MLKSRVIYEGRQLVYILLGAHAVGGGASRKWLRAHIGRPRGRARVPADKSVTALGVVATQDRIIPHYVPNSSIKHSKSDSKDRSQEILWSVKQEESV
jgi:hypothetical protein